jgi:hypothetical protein
VEKNRDEANIQDLDEKKKLENCEDNNVRGKCPCESQKVVEMGKKVDAVQAEDKESGEKQEAQDSKETDSGVPSQPPVGDFVEKQSVIQQGNLTVTAKADPVMNKTESVIDQTESPMNTTDTTVDSAETVLNQTDLPPKVDEPLAGAVQNDKSGGMMKKFMTFLGF